MFFSDIFLQKNAQWHERDREYTPSSSTLSAVWPDLRHGTYAWKVVSDDAIRRFAYVQPETAPAYTDYECTAPEVLACGETQVREHDKMCSLIKQTQCYPIVSKPYARILPVTKLFMKYI